MTAEERRWKADDRRRVAHHEAAHFVCAWAAGTPPAVVSIRPSRHFRGITIAEAGRTLAPDFDPTETAIDQLARPRAEIEADIVGRLAGGLASRWCSPLPDGYDVPDEEGLADRASAGLAQLTPRSRELVLDAETAPKPVDNDETAALHLSEALNGRLDRDTTQREAFAHVAWLRVVAERLMADYWADIVALADRLMEVHVLERDVALEVIHAARRGASLERSRSVVARLSKKPPTPDPEAGHYLNLQETGGVVLPRLLADMPADRRARCIMAVPLHNALIPIGAGYFRPGVRYASVGDVVDTHDPIVKAWPDHFGPDLEGAA